MAGRRPPSMGPSPSEDARRRNRDPQPAQRQPVRRQRYGEDADTPWLDEADYDEEGEGATHTLIGRRTLFALLALLGILTVGVVVGISLVSERQSAPIDVPEIGEEIPVLGNPGPWKRAPSGPDVDGIPVEGQGQIIYGTGVGAETEGRIDTSALPEDPLPRPGTASAGSDTAEMPAVEEALQSEARIVQQPPAPARPAPRPPGPVDTVVPRETPPAPAAPKAAPAPVPAPSASGSGTVLQLGAFSSQSRARAAFKSLADRYSYLDGLEPMIVPVESDGKTLYRLRSATAGSAAARDICGRLRVAGEACSVVN